MMLTPKFDVFRFLNSCLTLKGRLWLKFFLMILQTWWKWLLHFCSPFVAGWTHKYKLQVLKEYFVFSTKMITVSTLLPKKKYSTPKQFNPQTVSMHSSKVSIEREGYCFAMVRSVQWTIANQHDINMLSYLVFAIKTINCAIYSVWRTWVGQI